MKIRGQLEQQWRTEVMLGWNAAILPAATDELHQIGRFPEIPDVNREEGDNAAGLEKWLHKQNPAYGYPSK